MLMQTDQLLIVHIKGMHCHKCQERIKHSLQLIPGVHECEVDFPSALGSIIFDPATTKAREILTAIGEMGYGVSQFTTQSLSQAKSR
jgi:copper chaperone CopZ